MSKASLPRLLRREPRDRLSAMDKPVFTPEERAMTLDEWTAAEAVKLQGASLMEIQQSLKRAAIFINAKNGAAPKSGDAWKGKKHPPEVRAKMRESALKRWEKTKAE